MDFTTISISGLIAGLLSLGAATAVRRSIESAIDVKLEAVRSDFRREEARLKADLDGKGKEIEVLRSAALSGLAARQSQTIKRRIQAVETLSKCVVELNQLRFLAEVVKVTKIDLALEVSSKKAREAESMKSFAETLVANIPDIKDIGRAAPGERPFVSPWTWALYSAYSTLLIYFYTLLLMVKLGTGSAMVSAPENIAKIIKTALPEREDYLDKHGIIGLAYVVEELEAKLIENLRDSLENREADEADIRRSAQIVALAHEASAKIGIIAPIPSVA